MPSFQVFREPSSRYYYNWNPTLVRAAEIQANGGYLRLAADLCEWMMGDDRVMAVLDTRCDALLGLPFELRAEGKGPKSDQALTDLQEDWEYAFPEPEIKKLQSWGLMLGIGLAQLIWEERNGRMVPRLDVWSPRWLEWSWVTREWFLTVNPEGVDGFSQSRVAIEPGDGQWIIYTPSGHSRPWVQGAYRALSRWTLLKQYAIQDSGYYLERLGQGVWVAEMDAINSVGEGTKAERQQLSSDLQQLGRNSAIALNPGQRLRLIESVARTNDAFKQQIELADNGTAVSILGQNLTTQAGTGTMGAASVHRGVLHGRTRVDGKNVPTMLRTQALEPYAEYNYADRTIAPRPWWDTASIDDKDAQARVEQMTSQADAGLVGGGIMTVNEARAKRGLPPLPGGDVLRNAAASVPSSDTSSPAPAKSVTDVLGNPRDDNKSKPDDEDDET